MKSSSLKRSLWYGFQDIAGWGLGVEAIYNENDLVTKFFQVFHEYTNYYHTFCASR
jgi:hypothetical protein